MPNFSVVVCSLAEHGEQILGIFNEAIKNSTALYDYKPRTSESMVGWFETKKASNFPVIGLVSESGALMGFATFGAFRVQPAYKYTVEHSVYVHRDYRGKGCGKILLDRCGGERPSESVCRQIVRGLKGDDSGARAAPI